MTSANARSGQVNRGSIRPIDPKSLHFIDAPNQNDTFMVDDIKEIYDPLAANQVAVTTQKKSFKVQQQQQQPYGSNDRLIDSSQSDYDNRMRQELSGEDVYTLRFSTTVPMETFDATTTMTTPSKQQKKHQSYMYNGSINRPAFEIVSHADVRPATPIKFEETKELKHYHTVTSPRKRKSSMSPKKWNDEEKDCCDNQRRHHRRHHTHHHHHHSPRQSKLATQLSMHDR